MCYVRTIEPTTEIRAVIQIYSPNTSDEHCIIGEESCCAYLEGDEYRGVVVQAKTVSEALRELAISVDAINKYRLNLKKIKKSE